MVFIESAAFTRRLRELAGDYAEEVLSAIQDDLVANPERGSSVLRIGGNTQGADRQPQAGEGKARRISLLVSVSGAP